MEFNRIWVMQLGRKMGFGGIWVKELGRNGISRIWVINWGDKWDLVGFGSWNWGEIGFGGIWVILGRKMGFVGIWVINWGENGI